MNYEDVRFNILKSNQDLESLRHQCNVDQMSRRICTQRSFWSQLFTEQGLFLPTYHMISVDEWFVEYEKELVIKENIDKILRALSSPTMDDFFNNNGNEVHNDFDNNQLYVNNVAFTVLDFDEMDNNVIKIWNQWITGAIQKT